MPSAIDITGHKYGRLTALRPVFVGTARGQQRRWLCKCECGEWVKVSAGKLRFGHTRSCGCLMRETSAQTGRKRATHGDHGTRTYESWMSMRRRCQDPSHKSWKHYGGRGIAVCPEWEKYEQFRDDMGSRPKGKTLDRIDNEKGYAPANCRWATPTEQANNRRNNQDPEFCVNGHRWGDVGFRVARPSGRKGYRVCRECQREAQRKNKGGDK